MKDEKKRAHNKAWREKNPNYMAAYLKIWNAANKPLKAGLEALRRSRKLAATPAWLTPFQVRAIASLYEVAAQLTEATGIPHEVDHITPLQGVNVCGLHVPENLQIISAAENQSKGNRFVDPGTL